MTWACIPICGFHGVSKAPPSHTFHGWHLRLQRENIYVKASKVEVMTKKGKVLRKTSTMKFATPLSYGKIYFKDGRVETTWFS